MQLSPSSRASAAGDEVAPPQLPEGLVIGVTPFGEPDARLAVAVDRAGGLGVLDLGAGDRRAREALGAALSWGAGRLGVRVGGACAMGPTDVPAGAGGAGTLLLDAGTALDPGSPWRLAVSGERFTVLVEVTDVREARAAQRAGAAGLVARGAESGGRVGELGTFALLQQVLGDEEVTVPVWACGGIGLRTAAAAVLGGAAGVVLDTQLALLAEADPPADVAAELRRADGSGTEVADGYRLLRRPAGAPPLSLHPLSIGQDCFLAARFAAEFGTAGAAVRAVRDAAAAALAGDGAAELLGAGSAGSRALRTALPVVQGPMVGVSDQAAFAAAVADGGGLPFVALAPVEPGRTRALLEQTRAALGDRPWGVGLLGLLPEATMAAQLAEVRRARPAFAIVGGGRPAQAAALAADGIEAYLPVPSAAALRQFLAAGARRFVFEGAERGGHVGPLHSFASWEGLSAALTDYLSTVDDAVAGEVRVLFGGGVHDERSAAMVAAVAAPLARRGVAVGLLMGTAYLFTEEAVASGALRPGYQRQLVAAARTELLRTAPTLVTRCVPSPFADGFDAVRAELAAVGVPPARLAEELERLMLDRLWVAAKGVTGPAGQAGTGPAVERGGAVPVAVDADRQLTEGLFMAGQVAVLRSATTTVAALHESVTAGAARFCAARVARLGGPAAGAAATGSGAAATGGTADERPAPPPLDIAIVGMACAFPQAPDLPTFWSNVLGGVDAVTDVPADRWDVDTYYAASPAEHRVGRTTRSRWGGFLPDIPFDPVRFGIPPAALPSIDPAQLLSLRAAQQALDHAGYGGRDVDHSRTSVVFGTESGGDFVLATSVRSVLPAYFGEIPDEIDEQLPVVTEDTLPGLMANLVAGRIANRLNLGGANYVVDAACASSLAALDLACKELVHGNSDLALAGGVDVHNGINNFLMFAAVQALSPSGRCRSFDAAADGTTLGEGVACVVLKRLADAERDGDTIYGVIKGIGSASDGRSLGLTAPRPEGQRRTLERAYRNARIDPDRVGLVEAHGTGTVRGDRTELGALTEVFAEAGAEPGSCVLGSVKSQIGHTKCAAGLAGLIKATLAVYTGVRPPTLNLERPNPAWDAQASPFAFHTEPRPWAAAPSERIAGVSAFGFGGTNFHAVVAGYEASPPRQGIDAWPAELLLFGGADNTAADRAVEQLLELVETNDRHGRPWRLRDFAATACRRVEAGNLAVRYAVVASDLDELPGLLRRVRSGEHAPAAGIFAVTDATGGPAAGSSVADGPVAGGPVAGAPEVALLFPGQGSQRPGMLAELFVAFPEVQRFLRAGRDWADALFPPAAFDAETARAQAARITDTRVAQPALGIAGLAVHDLLTRAGVRPASLAGHSYGELVALCAAGAYGPDVLLELSAARAEAIVSAAGSEPGTMAAVSATPAEVSAVLAAAGIADVVVANHNAPRQAVISGPTAAVGTAVERLRAAGYGARPIPVAAAFHSPVVAAGGERFAAVLARQPIRQPEHPVWSNRTAARYPADAGAVRAELAAQIGAPVRFVDQIEAMYAEGVRVFVEAGPGSVLTGLVRAILGDRPHTALACEPRPGDSLRGFLELLAQLAVRGVRLRTGWLFRDRDADDLTGVEPPPRPRWTVSGHLVRTADGQPVPGGLRPARRVSLTSPPSGPEPLARPASEPSVPHASEPSVPPVAEPELQPVAQPDAQPLPESDLQPLPELVTPPVPGPDLQPAAAPTAPFVHETDAPSIHELTPQPALEMTVTHPDPEPARPVHPAPTHAALERRDASFSDREVLVAEFLRTSREMMTAQRDVLLSYFGSAAGGYGEVPLGQLPAPRHPVLEALAQRPAEPAQLPQAAAPVAFTPTEHVPVPQALVPAVAVGVDVARIVLEVIGERTGYPVEMIDPGLDLEADLSIDSIKRTEIAGELLARVGVDAGALAEDEAEDLARARTAAAVTGWLTVRLGAGTTGQARPAAAPTLVPTPFVPFAPGTAGPAPAAPAVPAPAVGPAPAAPAPVVAGGVDVARIVLEVIGERTGYPVEMIDPGLDLEADLSIDSIKRTEIAGELLARVGVDAGALAEDEAEDLARARTAAAVTEWLTVRLGGTPRPGTAQPGPAEEAVPERPETAGERPERYLNRLVPFAEPATLNPVAAAQALAGTRFVLLGDGGGLANSLTAALAAYGASATVLDAGHELTEADGAVDGVLYLAAVTVQGGPVLPGGFPAIKAALLRNPRWFLAIAPAAGTGLQASDRNVAGLRGLVRTVAKEYPSTAVKLVEMGHTGPDAAVAMAVIGELVARDSEPVVVHRAGGRYRFVVEPTALAGAAGGDARAAAAAAGLDRDSVVLVVGGARGITARCALALAAASGCRIELVGSTPLPTTAEDPATAAAASLTQLRAALAAQGRLPLPEIERTARRLLAQREIAATLRELRSLGCQVRYHALDVRDGGAVARLTAAIHAEHGRLDGIVYGAGVTEDSLVANTSAESFRRVFAIKVDGAAALLDAAAALPTVPRFALLFGSITAVVGSRGQVSYSTANDVLEHLGSAWAARTGQRAVTFHWGAWAPVGTHTGMVSPEVMRDYARRGLSMMDPEEGPLCLLRELAWGPLEVEGVTYTPSGYIDN